MSFRAENVVARPRGDRTVLGLALVAAGLVWFLGELRVLHVGGRALAAVALVAIGVGLIVTHRTGRKVWPILVGAVLTIGLLGHSATTAIRSRYGTSLGVQSFKPIKLSDLRTRYQVAAGAVNLDLSGTQFEPGKTRDVEIDVGAGAVKVMVPPGLALDVKAEDSVGAVTVFGNHLGSGIGVDREYKSSNWSNTSGPRLALDLRVGAGAATVSYSSDSGSNQVNPPTSPPTPSKPGAQDGHTAAQ